MMYYLDIANTMATMEDTYVNLEKCKLVHLYLVVNLSIQSP